MHSKSVIKNLACWGSHTPIEAEVDIDQEENLTLGEGSQGGTHNAQTDQPYQPEIWECHILQQRWMPQDKIAPFLLVDFTIMLCICFLKCLGTEKRKFDQ